MISNREKDYSQIKYSFVSLKRMKFEEEMGTAQLLYLSFSLPNMFILKHNILLWQCI